MRLYIPTRGRVDKQKTWDRLRGTGLDVVIVCEEDEVSGHQASGRSVIISPHLGGIAPKRQWILDNHDVGEHGPFLCMVDDDVDFSFRYPEKPDRYAACEATDLWDMFNELQDIVKQAPVAGFRGRYGAHLDADKPFSYNGRIMLLMAIDVRFFRDNDIRFDRYVFQEDFGVTLDVLKLGRQAVLGNRFLVGQSGSNSAGGCSSYRNAATTLESLEILTERHGDVVAIVKKKPWPGQDEDYRLDCRVSWAKAYKAGCAAHPNEPTFEEFD